MTMKASGAEATTNLDNNPSLTIVKRSGSLVPFRKERILLALEAAFRDTKKCPKPSPLSDELSKVIENLCDQVAQLVFEEAKTGHNVNVEQIQDLVELSLMKEGYHDVAKDYIIYRDKHKQLRDDAPENMKIYRKDGILVRFSPIKISSSIADVFTTFEAHDSPSMSGELQTKITDLTLAVISKSQEANKSGIVLSTNLIEEFIEKQLMEAGLFAEAKQFILRSAGVGITPIQRKEKKQKQDKEKVFHITGTDGSLQTLTESALRGKIEYACRGLPEVSPQLILEASLANFYEGIKSTEVDQSNIMAARALIEKEPSYSKVAARLLRDVTFRETMEVSSQDPNLEKLHRQYFKKYIKQGIAIDRLSPDLLSYDLDKLSKAFDLSRDDQFTYLGLQTLYDRYFIHEAQRRLETPQIFWMRVAMGLALREKEKEQRAIEFYNLMSRFDYTPSTPTLFNAGTRHSQLSSCYLLTVEDDLSSIFKLISDDAQLSKWAGGIGNDWTPIRATGSTIKGTNGSSQGVIPFLKVANDTAVAVNQGGKRKGAMCAYLETWHLDIEDFLELRKNTGDERRRTHDMNTANWIPDLFMKRVLREEKWTLFSPSDVSDLHDLYGTAFEEKYCEYEKRAKEGKLKLFKEIEAVQLWRKMLSMLFETGHPWITFKDPSNIRSPQDHAGVVHSSNLCTEILLNTSSKETAVCNIGSINLLAHTTETGIDEKKLAATIKTAIRMLDNVIDINFYPTEEAKLSNQKHRPIGIGLMGFQDALYKLSIPYASHAAVEFADASMEMISYYAILSSAELAKERGPYASYPGSKWSRGILPIDTIDLLEKERDMPIQVDRSTKMDWTPVREAIAKWGMRNSNTMAIAPTATISNITGITQSIEPTYKNLYVKSNLSGEFTIPNTFLVDRLKKEGIWDPEMLDDLKYFDGSIAEIPRIPQHTKDLFATSFEIDPEWIIECASRRQKWIDMGQSLNLYLSQPSGKRLHQMYMMAWVKGLKTTYYCRTLAATQIEKSTTDINKRGIQPRWMKSASASSSIRVEREEAPQPKKACSLDGDCESCQ